MTDDTGVKDMNGKPIYRGNTVICHEGNHLWAAEVVLMDDKKYALVNRSCCNTCAVGEGCILYFDELCGPLEVVDVEVLYKQLYEIGTIVKKNIPTTPEYMRKGLQTLYLMTISGSSEWKTERTNYKECTDIDGHKMGSDNTVQKIYHPGTWRNPTDIG